jgi:hypothetical protein
MNIAVIGTGRVGATLGAGWAKRGHTVVFASREPEGEKAQAAVAAAGPGASAASVVDAVRSAGVVVLAVPWSALQSSLAAAGDLQGKVLVDATNAIGPGLIPGFAPPASAAEQVAAWAPGARVVKAFNTTGFDNMADPVYEGQATTMFICGDDPAAKATVAGLAEALGFEAADAGPLAAAFHLENLALLWIHLARQPAYGRDIAFRLLRR